MERRSFFLTFFLLALLLSCSKDGTLKKVHYTDTPSRQSTGIAKGTEILNEEDAIAVARIFKSGEVQTKAVPSIPIRSVVTIKDESEEPCYYVVNYDKGYTLVSATTKYPPILADVEQGMFTGAPTGTGADVLLQEYKDAIVQAKRSGIVNENHSWEAYYERRKPERLETKLYVNPALYDVLDPAYEEWMDAGYDIYPITQQPSGLDDDVYQRFVEIASEYSPNGYPWQETAKITVEHRTVHSQYGPYLTTQWGQGYPYNYLLSGGLPLGCATIAVGQIMKYFQHPSTYNWSAMPNSTSNYTLSSFLTTLRSQLQVDDDGIANINRAKYVFSSIYNYNCSLGAHSSSSAYSSLVNGRPVFMYGYDTSSSEGHFWVCDGESFYQYYTKYVLRVLCFNGNQPSYYDIGDEEEYFDGSYMVFHMNFGWYGNHDGYYSDTFTITGSETMNYMNYRKDIIISGHN